MKTLRGLEVAGAIYLGDGLTPVDVGDTVQLYLDTDANSNFPEYIEGTVVAPVTPVECDSKISYSIEYDEADLEGAADLLRVQDVVDWRGVSQIEAFATDIAGKLPLTGGTLTGSLTINKPGADAPILFDADNGLIDLWGGAIIIDGGTGTITVGTINLGAPLPVANGGTGAASITGIRNTLGINSYSTLANANAGEGLTGSVFWDSTLGKYRSTTASS